MSEDTTMFKLTENGDLDVSDNGVIRTISGIPDTTYQSAAHLVGTVKGSYPFVPDMGLDVDTIFSTTVDNGMDTIENIEYLSELFIAKELEKDPNIATVTNFIFDFDRDTRKLSVTFEISTIAGQATAISLTV